MGILQGIIAQGQHRETMNFLWTMGIGVFILCGAFTIGLLMLLKNKPRGINEADDEALKALRLRYANGEISEEQYNHQRDVLIKG